MSEREENHMYHRIDPIIIHSKLEAGTMLEISPDSVNMVCELNIRSPQLFVAVLPTLTIRYSVQ